MVELCQSLGEASYMTPMKSGTVQRLGVKLQSGSTWIGKTINAVSFWLKWSGVGTGTCYGRIYRDGTTDPIITFGSKDITTINTDDAEKVTFTGADYELLEDDIICCENHNGATAIIYMIPYFGGVINYLIQMRYGASWSEAAGESVKLCITTAGVASFTKLPPSPITVRF